MGDEGAEGGIDPVDAGERCGVNAGLLQQSPALRPLLASLGVAATQVPGDGVGEGFEAGRTAGRQVGRRQGGEQRMAGLQLPVERFALQHPAVVVGGMAEGHRAAGGGKAANPGGVELTLTGPGPAT